LDDLRFAQSVLTGWYPSLRTEAYYAAPDGDCVRFEAV